MREHENLVSHELRVAARGRSARTPLIVYLSVAVIVFGVAGIVTLIALLVYWLSN
jgi:hypothetical protein